MYDYDVHVVVDEYSVEAVKKIFSAGR